jgi:hypothetical protein
MEMDRYSLTLGGLLHEGADDADLVRARQLVNVRDESHLHGFGHLPGSPGCSLAAYDQALAGAVSSVRAERRGATMEGTTALVAAELNKLGPWLNVQVGVDPMMAGQRAELAQKVAALRVGRLSP